MPPSLNLLRHPRGARVDARWLWPVLSGAAAGLLVVGAVQLWQTQQLEALQARHEQLQAELKTQGMRRQAAERRREHAKLQESMALRARDWQSRREQQSLVQDTLDAQARSLGLRIERWQIDAHRVSLQLWLPKAQQLPGVVAALTQVGPADWVVSSLAERPVGGIDAVLEAAWPSAKVLPVRTGKP